jgi:tRNA A-37 threonylcarbamoyl transferase component Bud32
VVSDTGETTIVPPADDTTTMHADDTTTHGDHTHPDQTEHDATEIAAPGPMPQGTIARGDTPRGNTPRGGDTPRGGETPADTPNPTPTNLGSSTSDIVLEPGTMLGDYRIENKIAEGGWGSVFSAVHPLIGKRVAVKVLKKQLCRYPAAVERFVDEARAVNTIGHPNIVDVFTFGVTPGGRSYFMMEWLKGETLAKRLPRGHFTVQQICAIVKPLALALEAAHAKGIIHRDLKPDNVFLVYIKGEQPRVKLLDFGIAKLAVNKTEPDRPERTSTGEIVGTPQHMAPEQARGRIDHRVDIYALGGVLFELLTGRTPFQADNAADMIAKLLTEPAPRASSLAAGVPAELDRLAASMLAKDPVQRPSLREVCTVLDHLLERVSAPEPARSLSAPRRAARAATSMLQRGRRPWLWIAIAIVIAFALFDLGLVAKRHGDARAREAELASSGRLLLTVSGASSFDVLVDDQKTVPGAGGELLLTPGMHAIEVRSPGMASETFQVTATAGVTLPETIELHHANR